MRLHAQARPSRRAVTMLELVLVLALLVAMAGMAWPLLQRGFDNRRLQMSAEQLRADLTSTRLKAINTGRVFVLEHVPGASSYTITPYLDGLSEQVNTAALSEDGAPRDYNPADLVRVVRKLPDDVRFLVSEGLQDERDEAMLSEIQSTGLVGVDGVASNDPSAEKFFCYPDGTTATARFRLANLRGRWMTVDVRGLTGVATLGEITSGTEVLP